MDNVRYEIIKASQSAPESHHPYYVKLYHDKDHTHFWLKEFRKQKYRWPGYEVTEKEILAILGIARDELLERGIINELE